MSRFGFCGPTYRSQSVNADCQLTQNLYPENDEGGSGSSATVMYPTPGTLPFGICPDSLYSPVRGLFISYSSSRVFTVIGTGFYELLANGTMIGYLPQGTLIDDGRNVSFAENNANQLIFCCGGQLWCFPLTTGLSRVAPPETHALATIAFVY